MKKRELSLILLFVVLFFLLIANLPSAKAQTEPQDAREVLAREFNVSLDKIPTNQKDLERFYLQHEWSKTISQNRVLGPVHNFLLKVPIVSRALFAYPYEFSMTFLLILILWVFIWYHASKIVEGTGFVKGGIAVIIGALVAIILAQIRF